MSNLLYSVSIFLEYLLMSLPSTRIVPPSEVSIPPRRFRTVVLPAPEAPTTTAKSPFSMVKSTPSTAVIVTSPIWYLFCTLLNSINDILSSPVPSLVCSVILPLTDRKSIKLSMKILYYFKLKKRISGKDFIRFNLRFSCLFPYTYAK